VALAKAEHKEGDYIGAGVITRRAAMSGKSKSVDPDGIYDRHYSNKNCVFFAGCTCEGSGGLGAVRCGNDVGAHGQDARKI